MERYRLECARRGWICACPTAVTGDWASRRNTELIDALLDELLALYNVDERRVYLIGHSLGGGGAWVHGARRPETWAAIAAASSYRVQGIDRLRKARTGFYVYHSDDDSRAPVVDVRRHMELLPGSGADFVYTELPGRGHEFPADVVADIFLFFALRGRADRPTSSFLRKPSRDERRYLPPLDENEPDDSLNRLLKDLRTGGGVSARAVRPLSDHEDPRVSARVAKILLRPDATPDVRGFAARILGARRAKDQIDALGRVLLIETDGNALLEALSALQEIGDARAGDHLLRFLKKRGAYLDRRTRDGAVDHGDWVVILPGLARACALVGSFRPRHGAKVIAETVLEGVFLVRREVTYDAENQDPLPAARALAASAASALRRLGDPVAISALERAAKSAWARDSEIVAHFRAALRSLRG
jgi:hypothetical protein